MLNEKYKALSMPPGNALKTIQAGNLKGKSDINPQWRIEALTEMFGLCGYGWRFEVVEKTVQPLDDGQIILFMQINLYVKDGDAWSAPIPGFGGEMIREKNKNGLVPNDEAYKMCLTDALGNAAKCIGVAADIYRGMYDSKYSRESNSSEYYQAKQQQAAPKQHAAVPAGGKNKPWVKIEGTNYYVLANSGKYIQVENLKSVQQCNAILADMNYALAYEAVKAQRNVLALAESRK